ncbi:PAS domain S-box protein [bacterium]|nr:PAS domain S-box protein [bacterium]MBU1434421.1 PAS domain S-box protein [bacterium]MBU1501999.1 PAS domain S-box protein [bacterium]
MNKIVAFLAKLGFWPFVLLFTTLMLILSELLVLLHSYWLTGGFFDKNLLTAGFIIPIIVGLIGFGLVAFLVRYLRDLEEEKNKTAVLQKETEEKLKKSENYQGAILDSFPFLVWLKDTDSNFLAVNRPFAKAAGLENPLELIGKNDLDFFPKDLADAYRADDQVIMKSLQKKELEEFIEGNGERRWHATYKAPILDKEGNLVGTVGFARDITNDKEAEEELKLMKHALDHVREAVFLTEEGGGFVYVNDGATRALGYTKKELKTMAIYDIDPGFPRSQMALHWEEIKTNGMVTISSIHKNKAGRIFPVEVNAHYIEYRGKEYNLAFVKDITERKISQEKLKLSASVFTHTHEGILISDADNKIIDVNEAFTTITGYLKADVLGKSPKILKSGRNSQEFYAQLWDSLHKDGVWKGELWNRKKTGEEYVENATISVVYDDNKAIQNYISIFTDITEQKRQHQELEHHAHYDVLTNLPNRMLFADRMQQAISQAIRKQKFIAVAYIDIDGFKAVNDTYGHIVGDKLLILLAEKMTNLLREGDTVSRIGGDEFIALFVDISNEERVTPFLSRLIETIAEPITIDDFPINVSASIGVTSYPKNEKLNIEQIIRQADQAMYIAKESGKNRYVMYDKQYDNSTNIEN